MDEEESVVHQQRDVGSKPDHRGRGLLRLHGRDEVLDSVEVEQDLQDVVPDHEQGLRRFFDLRVDGREAPDGKPELDDHNHDCEAHEEARDDLVILE